MKTYQLIFKGGLTRNVEADGYYQTKHHLVLFVDGGPEIRLDVSRVIMIDEIRDFEPSLVARGSSLALH